MFINSNIRYLRKLKRLSQENFAERLGLNRGNIASYENNSHPPLEIILKISEWYNISTDALLKTDLEKSLSFKADKKGGNPVKAGELMHRLRELMTFTEKDEAAFAKMLQCSQNDLHKVLTAESALGIEMTYALIEACPWLSLNWFFRGEGAMVEGNQEFARKVAEPDENIYVAQSQLDAIQNSLLNITLRLERIEQSKS